MPTVGQPGLVTARCRTLRVRQTARANLTATTCLASDHRNESLTPRSASAHWSLYGQTRRGRREASPCRPTVPHVEGGANGRHLTSTYICDSVYICLRNYICFTLSATLPDFASSKR